MQPRQIYAHSNDHVIHGTHRNAVALLSYPIVMIDWCDQVGRKNVIPRQVILLEKCTRTHIGVKDVANLPVLARCDGSCDLVVPSSVCVLGEEAKHFRNADVRHVQHDVIDGPLTHSLNKNVGDGVNTRAAV
jgi:hypothetical protein